MRLFLARLGKIFQLWREYGLKRVLALIWTRLFHVAQSHTRVDVFAHYDFVLAGAEVTGIAPLGNECCRVLNWYVPDFNVGSGGHLNIFRMIWHLEKMGYASNIILSKLVNHSSAEHARQEICAHFYDLNAKVFVLGQTLPAAQFSVATAWDTAYHVRRATNTKHKLYFVQDYEPSFYPHGTEWALADNTYRFGFFGITAGGWLANLLTQSYGMQVAPVGFGVELDRYRRLPRREPHRKRVFFYARPPTPRRAFELGLMVLNQVWKHLPNTEFILAGWDTSNYFIPFPHLSAGTVSLDELPDLYSQCDVGLVISLTNLSLLPLELMACGCVVVSNTGPNVEWLLQNGENAVLTSLDPEEMAHGISKLLMSESQLSQLSQKGEAFAKMYTWQKAANDFELALKQVEKAEHGDSNCVA